MSIETDIAERLRKLRVDKDLSQRQVAEMLMISKDTYIKWEKDAKIAGSALFLEKVGHIGAIYEVTIPYILYGTW